MDGDPLQHIDEVGVRLDTVKPVGADYALVKLGMSQRSNGII